MQNGKSTEMQNAKLEMQNGKSIEIQNSKWEVNLLNFEF
jgi:hypothetical protein